MKNKKEDFKIGDRAGLLCFGSIIFEGIVTAISETNILIDDKAFIFPYKKWCAKARCEKITE